MAALAIALLAGGACGDDGEGGGEAQPPDLGADTDGDGIPDGDEGREEERNTDGDAWPDWRDLDSDGDGIPDASERGGAAAAADTDGDGTPDYLDTDADGDGIPDAVEPAGDADGDGIPDALEPDGDGDLILDRQEGADDLDRDGRPNPLDDDSDGDGISDRLEAGDDDLATSPVDTDLDGQPDFLDLDSDGDLVPDAQEDLNGNGLVDPCAAVGAQRCESSPTSADTDGDGTPDLVEHVAGSNPADPTSDIPEGDFFFVLPHQGPSQSGTFTFSTTLRKADVFFSVDTTGSFDQEIASIQGSLRDVIVPGVRAAIPDVGFGVGRFEDFPLEPYGLPGDLPYELLQVVTEDPDAVAAGVAALPPAAGGLDTPEAGIEALYQWAAGTGVPSFALPPFTSGGAGGVGFRPDALPIVVQITDARSHAPDDYAAFSGEAHSAEEAIAALSALGARVIGVDSLENAGTPDDPRAELELLAHATGATVPPDAGGSCATGVGGAPRPAAGGACPLVFDVLPDGSGLGTLIVDAIVQLASFGTLDISTRLEGATEDLTGAPLPAGVTTAAFVTAVTPVAPPPPGATIVGDAFVEVTPGSAVAFEVTAANDFLPPEPTDQLFQVEIEVLGDAVTVLDVKRVFVIVPRVIEPPGSIE